MTPDPSALLTLWDPDGDLARALDRAHPILAHGYIGVTLHAGPSRLADHAPSLTERIRATYGPEIPVYWAVAGDSGSGSSMTPAELLRRRRRSAEAAWTAHVNGYELNCEAAWKRQRPGFDARAARDWVETTREVFGTTDTAVVGAPSILLTSYDQPTQHTTFPWRAFNDVDIHAPQIYSPTDPQRRLVAHNASWEQAAHLGWVRRRRWAYLYGTGPECSRSSPVADTFATTQVWASHWLDAHGRTLLRALGQIQRHGFTGPDRVRAFQRSRGLKVDGRIGPKTAAELRVPYPKT